MLLRLGLLLVPLLALPATVFAQPAATGDVSTSGTATDPRPDPSSDRELARRLFRQGVEAYDEGRFKDAVDLLKDADRAMHSPAFSYNIGLAYEAMGDAANALRWYRAYLRELPDAEDREEVDQRISDLELQLQRRGVQQITVMSKPEAATVLIDGRPVGVTPWTGELRPGKHLLGLQLRGYEDAEQQFEVRAHRARDLVVDLVPAQQGAAGIPAGAANEPAADADLSREARPSAGFGPWPWVLYGAGTLAFGGALAFELARASAEDDAREAAQVDYLDKLDTAQSRQRTARIFAGAGAAFVAAGTALLVIDLTRGESPSPVAAACAPDGCAVTAKGKF